MRIDKAQNKIIQTTAAEYDDCAQCGKDLKPGDTIYCTEYGDCCTRDHAVLRIQDVESRDNA